MYCTTAEGITFSLIVITTGKKQVDVQWYVITVIDISLPNYQSSDSVLCRNLCLRKKPSLYLKI